ncbi:MAG: VCBS repeat-containing protein [Chitinophagaceae bacterium]|nr:VCBS repeat-containing protein [Chitinophagaceae bacterium]
MRNDSKNGACAFTDVTRQSGIKEKPGMVTAALWTDFDNDGWQDLVVLGEFMPIRFFKNTRGSFREITAQTGLQHTSGWWNSIVAGDFDHDGDIDYVAGNLGLNGPYKASSSEPVCIYAHDYDNNGRLDPVMCHFYEGKEYIVHSRDDINKQMTAMRARFKDYASYAGVTFKEAFLKDEIAKAYVVKAETFASAYIENLGGGKFSLHNLPVEAQFAPIYGMVCSDFDGDGNPDVLCAGNSYSAEVQSGRYDAQGSVLLTGDGKGNFFAKRNAINIAGDNKALAQLINADGSSLFLVSSNNDSLHAFRFNGAHQKVLNILPDDAYAILASRKGVKSRQEFYYGSTYLSQSTRRLIIAPEIRSVVIYNNNGNSREIIF